MARSLFTSIGLPSARSLLMSTGLTSAGRWPDAEIGNPTMNATTPMRNIRVVRLQYCLSEALLMSILLFVFDHEQGETLKLQLVAGVDREDLGRGLAERGDVFLRRTLEHRKRTVV